ncbi:hypothetical protein WJX72_000396 [[Myrmecia] bisecta]|uniref:Uncharacterized protein n=1 Tax=[Myrmecia] bisecta TaxID=41462 RepID=A0AAW1QNX4_9CHLO
MKFKLPFRRKAKTNVLPIPPRQPVPPGVFVEEARLGLLGTAPSTSDRFDFHASPEPRYTAETLQRSLADLCATHHVSLAKLREQMGNMAEPAETVLQLSARRVFAQRYMLRSRLDSTGAISDLSPALGFGPSTSTGEASKQHSGGQANDAGGSKKAGPPISRPQSAIG